MYSDVYRGGIRSPVVVLNTYDREGDEVYERIKEFTSADFTFVAVGGFEWNDDLSPWEAEPLPRTVGGFGGEADDYLEMLTEIIVPKAVKDYSLRPEHYMLAGYSLAGLFALYSMYRTDMFSHIISVSGSLWFPGFMDFVRGNWPKRDPDLIYLSLGDAESRTRNERMRTVMDNTRGIADWYTSKGVETVFEINPGGHFDKPYDRTARAIAYALDHRR
jgi:hypothetical protein